MQHHGGKLLALSVEQPAGSGCPIVVLRPELAVTVANIRHSAEIILL